MLSPDRFHRLMELFAELADLPESEQATRISALGESDMALRARLESMLSADRAPVATVGGGARLLAQEVAAVPEAGQRSGADRQVRTTHGRRGLRESAGPLPQLAGQYRMLRLIGEGGMGTVYEAEQSVPRRRVAIKVIRSSFASRRLLRRFAHEAHILGRLHHPGIAQIYEAGVGDVGQADQAFFVMEFVDGPPLTTWASERHIDVSGRLELLARVGEAVAHAHQRGVIHRDLKPANILVDPLGQPKVLDFGVARVLDGDLELTTHLTSIGQLVGTLPYMSPEQVAGDPREVDVRSDVYALGVILYELVAGRLPHDVARLPIPEAARVIREQDPPRLGGVVREARGDIETIVQKAMAKEKERRYGSAAELVADLRRCLAHEPIVARQHSTLYVIRRQLRRYPGFVTAAAVLAISLAAFSIHSWRQSAANAELAWEAESARRLAVDEAARADEYAGKLERELAVSRVERGRLFGRADNIRAAEGLLWPELLRDPGSSLAYHALMELYLRHPCIAAWPSDSPIDASTGTPLPAAVGGPLGVVNVPAGVRSLACHPTLPRIACGLMGGGVVVLDADDGRVLARAEGFGLPVWSVEYLPDGAIAVADQSGSVSMLEPQALALRWTRRGHDAARALQALADGTIISGGADGTLVRWSPEGEVLASSRLRSAVWELAASPDGPLLAACADGVARLLTPELEPLGELQGATSVLSAATFSLDGATAFASGADRTIRAWNVADLAPLFAVRRPDGTIRSVVPTPDGRSLLSAGWWRLSVWSMQEMRVERTISLQESASDIAFLADRRRLAVGQLEGVVRLFIPSLEGPRRQIAGGQGPATLRLSADGALLAWGDEQGATWLQDARTGQVLRRLEGPTARLGDFAFSPGGARLAGASRDGQLFLWRCEDGALLARRKGTNCASSRSLAYSPDGSLLASCLRGGKIALLDPDSLEAKVTVGGVREALSVAFAPDGRSFVTAAREPILQRWSLDGAPLAAYEGRSTPWVVAIAPDQRTVAVGNWAKVIDLFDFETGERRGELAGHAGLVHDVTFPAGRSDRLLSTSADGEVRLWEISRRRSLLTFDAVPGWEAMAVDRSPDGETLFASTANGEILAWELGRLARSVAGNLAYAVRMHGDADDPAMRPLLEWAAGILRGERVEGPWDRASPDGHPGAGGTS